MPEIGLCALCFSLQFVARDAEPPPCAVCGAHMSVTVLEADSGAEAGAPDLTPQHVEAYVRLVTQRSRGARAAIAYLAAGRPVDGSAINLLALDQHTDPRWLSQNVMTLDGMARAITQYGPLLIAEQGVNYDARSLKLSSGYQSRYSETKGN